MMKLVACLLPTTMAVALLLPAMAPAEDIGTGQRVERGLLALYDFQEGGGDTVADRAGVGRPADLRIRNMDAVRWAEGALEVHGDTLIRTEVPPVKLTELVRRGGEITLEAWIRPAEADQKGPARIATLSSGGSARNITLGQDGNRYDVRLRTTATSGNGIPSHQSGGDTLQTELTHVVYTRDRDGGVQIYLDGERKTRDTIGGDLDGWDRDYHFALGNEMSSDRGWRGTYHLVALYSRALAPGEVAQNFRAGPAVAAPVRDRPAADAPEERFFNTRVAPILSRHCLECHDTSSAKGRLDLSVRDKALAATNAIVPGDAAASLLWKTVESDEMPDDRPPLSPDEKAALKAWIDGGAVWPMERIDPAVYLHGGGSEVNWLRRLTVTEYIETVHGVTGVDIAPEAREWLPPDLRADGFSNTAYNLGVDLAHVEAYGRLAARIVVQMDVPAFAARHIDGEGLSLKTLGDFIAGAGALLLRGPLSAQETKAYTDIAAAVELAGGDAEEAAAYILEAMLQAPRFLYRVEQQIGDGYPWPAGDHELAARLSYILWGAPPDGELLEAAEAGLLGDGSARNAQVDRMLADPRARQRASQFAKEWLNLGHVDNLRPNAERFPGWTPELAADMRAETLAYFDEVAWVQGRPLADLFNADFTFATPRLAEHYGLEPQGDGLARYDLSDVPARGGLLTQGSLLTMGGDNASTVTRGLFVLNHILRGTVNNPPPGLDTSPVPPRPGESRRMIAEARVANRSCGGCHTRFEPLSYGLERFDGIGAYSETDEHGNALREDGEVLFPGEAAPAAYRTAAELMDLLAGSDRVKKTITWKAAQFALGRPLAAVDAPAVDAIHEAAQRGGGTYTSLMRAIVSSDLVLTTRTEVIQ